MWRSPKIGGIVTSIPVFRYVHTEAGCRVDLHLLLEGERKQVAVFFADLKGSMELLADRDPEEARKLLDLETRRR